MIWYVFIISFRKPQIEFNTVCLYRGYHFAYSSSGMLATIDSNVGNINVGVVRSISRFLTSGLGWIVFLVGGSFFWTRFKLGEGLQSLWFWSGKLRLWCLMSARFEELRSFLARSETWKLKAIWPCFKDGNSFWNNIGFKNLIRIFIPLLATSNYYMQIIDFIYRIIDFNFTDYALTPS